MKHHSQIDIEAASKYHSSRSIERGTGSVKYLRKNGLKSPLHRCDAGKEQSLSNAAVTPVPLKSESLPIDGTSLRDIAFNLLYLFGSSNR
mmetsp:Transcript_27416/g.56880  ORF Transcript_27416/g.56880 Transcript_27416/m.56880 type:complete len:90 (+) Transcript_27416:126-395(+)